MKVIKKSVLFLGSILPAKHKRKALILSSFLLVNSALELIGLGALIPVFTVLLDDDVVSKYAWAKQLYETFNLTSENQLIILVSIILLLIIIIKNIMGIAISYSQSRFAFSLYEFFSIKLHGIYYRKGAAYFKDNNAHNLVRNINFASLQFSQKQVLGLISLLNELVILVVISICIFLYNPKIFGLLMVTIVPTFSIFYLWVRKKSLQIGTSIKKITPLLSKNIFQSIYGYVDIILAEKELTFRNKVKENVSELSKAHINSAVINLIPTRIIESSIILAVTLIIIFGLSFSLEKVQLIQLLGLFAIAGYRIMPSVNRIMVALNGLNQTLWTFDILQLLKASTASLPAQKEMTFSKELSLNNICFHFEDSSTALFDNFTMRIKKGECVGIVGPSGSGKTTLMNMFLGFISPQKGTLQIDTQTFDETYSQSYYKKVGYVQQQVYIMDGTIAENIALGVMSSKINYDAIETALKKASLYSFVSELPNGIDTHIGENGTKLSGGQRQRVGIARALYREVEILFFDEATSALDEQTEQEITQSIERLIGGELTICIIAHRLSTLKNCDRIIEIVKDQATLK